MDGGLYINIPDSIPQLDSLDAVISSIIDQSGFVNEIDYHELEFLEIVGRGAFGTVHKARWKGFIVAIKRIENENATKELADEVEQLSNVRHKNIISLFGTSIKMPKVCLVMEYAECGSLYNFLHPDGCQEMIPYTFGHVMSWSLQCAEAVAYLHGLTPSVVHRDLKPPNMLLTNRGTVIKLCDFGTACTKHTIMTSNRGSASWMAPEVFEGTRYTEKCDVYSFGIILWEMLTRRKPFDEIGPPAFRIMWKVHSGTRPPPIQAIPQCLEDLMERCWTKDEQKRPPFTEIVEFFTIANQYVAGGNDPIFTEDVCDHEGNCSSFESTGGQLTSVPMSSNQESVNPSDTPSSFVSNVEITQEDGFALTDLDSSILDYSDTPPPIPEHVPSDVTILHNFPPVIPPKRKDLFDKKGSSPNQFTGATPPLNHYGNAGSPIFPPYSSLHRIVPIDEMQQSMHTMQLGSVSPQHVDMANECATSSGFGEGGLRRKPDRCTSAPVLGDLYMNHASSIDFQLVPQELMPVTPIDSEPTSVRMYENYMGSLKKYTEIQAKIKVLVQKRDYVNRRIEEVMKEQKRDSYYLEDYIRQQNDKQNWLVLHGELKTLLEREKAKRALQIANKTPSIH